MLNADERRAIDRTDGFWQLVESGYVSYRRSGHARHEIVGHKFVGRARIGDIELQVREKTPGALRGLIEAATGGELRIEVADSPATEFDTVSRHLMDEFTRAAGLYVAERRRPRYAYQDTNGPILAGSLDMAATIRLHARGQPGRFAYRQGRVVRDEPLDRLVLAGLDELDRAGLALGIYPTTLYEARWLAGALEEVRDESFVMATQQDFLAYEAAIEGDIETLQEDSDLARLAAVALLHRGFELDGPAVDEVPRAWFIDLEALFEQAVRSTLRDLLDANVDQGANYTRRMFTEGLDNSRTHPDIVIHDANEVGWTGDVKYKALEGAKESRADVYQLLVHAASLDSDRAFLAYPGDSYAHRYLGRSATGCRTWACEVRPTRLADDLARFVEDADLPSS